MIDYEAIKNKIYQQARDLEVALYNYYFLNDSHDMVILSLSLYQNKDGGFHNVEPDCTNPNSSPFQTSYALEMLMDMKLDLDTLDDFSKQVIKKALNYLDKTINVNKWPRTIPTNDQYPKAIWWQFNEHEDSRFNPTASIIASILYFADKNSPLYKKALKLKAETIALFMDNDISDKHDLMCLARLIDRNQDEMAYLKLTKSINSVIDLSSYEGYITTPIDFPLSNDNYGIESSVIDQTVDYLNKTFKRSYWDISWTWMNEDEGFDVQAFKWHGIVAIKNLRFLYHIKK